MSQELALTNHQVVGEALQILTMIGGQPNNLIQYGANGAVIQGDLPYSDWATTVTFMASRSKAIEGVSTAWQLILGDLIVYGEDKYGEKSSQVLDDLVRAGVDRKYLNNMAYCARKVGPPLRSEGVTWSHMLSAAAIPSGEDRRVWLGRAAKDKLSTRDFNAAIAPLKTAYKKPKEKDEPEYGAGYTTLLISPETYSQLCAVVQAHNSMFSVEDTPVEFLAGWIEKAYLALDGDSCTCSELVADDPEALCAYCQPRTATLSERPIEETCTVCGGPRDIPLARGGFLSQCRECRNEKRRVAE